MPVKTSEVGGGRVVLIAGGGRTFADMAARFVRSERDLEEIAASPYDREIVRNILRSGHLSALEFDWFLFGVEGYSRVCEAQLVRKRHASYMIKSGRAELGGKRAFSVVLPPRLDEFSAMVRINGEIQARMSGADLVQALADWYEAGARSGIPEEDLRYLKPQATEFRGLIGMNAHALRDFFRVRCCMNAQSEIRDMARKMLSLCREVSPVLFEGAGPNCAELGYCPENDRQSVHCRGKIPTKATALRLLAEERRRMGDRDLLINGDCWRMVIDQFPAEEKESHAGILSDARRFIASAEHAEREGRLDDAEEWHLMALRRIRRVQNAQTERIRNSGMKTEEEES